MKKLGILGTGTVGRTLAVKMVELGYEVMLGTRNKAEKLADTTRDSFGNPSFSEWHKENAGISLGTFNETAAFGEVIINATQGMNSLKALHSAGKDNLSGKILIDVSNPLDFSKGMPPSLIPELSNTNSLGEEIQRAFPGTKVVKTFNTMWCGIMVQPGLVGGGDHTNYLCGNDADAKTEVKSLLEKMGWKHENLLDIGDITSARGTEAVLPVWLRIMGVKQNGAFNFKVVN